MRGRGGDAAVAPGEMDLRELGFILARGWKWIFGGALLGLLAGMLVLWLVPARYEGRASILLRSPVPGGSSALSELSDLLTILPINFGGSALETETAILNSRAVLGEVVDSLGLQVEVLEPRGTPPDALFEEIRAAPHGRTAEYRFAQRAEGYEITGLGVLQVVAPGSQFMLGDTRLTLARSGLPERFEVRLQDRESAIDALEEGLSTKVVGGEVVEVVYWGRGPELAAAVPNTLLARYLERRKTIDRVVNQYRYEFLRDHVDSISAQLLVAEQALRRHQEVSGVFDPALVAESGLRRVTELRAQLEGTQVEARALQGILAQADAGRLSARELAAYPTFITNPAINGLLSRLLDLETQRVALLERRPPTDPEIAPLTQSIEHLESRLVAISIDYLQGLRRREAELMVELSGHQGEMDRLPTHAETGLRLEREVLRLSETEVALQTQLVAARLAAITEGGDVRQVDVAVTSREPVFPRPILSLGGGLLGGLFFGSVAAVAVGRLRRRICNPLEAEIATGVPTLFFGPQVPLSFPEAEASRGVLLIPADPAADVVPVGERIATTAALQGREAVLVDLTHDGAVLPTRFADHVPVGKIVARDDASGKEHSGESPHAVYRAIATRNGDGRSTLADLETRSSMVVAALPHVWDASTVSVLGPGRVVVIVAPVGIARATLQEAIDSCTRMGATVLRIVLQPLPGRRWS